MFPILLLLFTLVPLAEIALLVQLGSQLGFWPTLALVLGTGVAGAALAKWQGLRVLERIQRQLAEGVMPAAEIIDGALLLGAGLLLITPGALTDMAGIALLLPPVRRLVRRLAVDWFAHRVRVRRIDPRDATAYHEWPSPPRHVVDAPAVAERFPDEDPADDR